MRLLFALIFSLVPLLAAAEACPSGCNQHTCSWDDCDVAACICFGTACGVYHDCDPPEDPCPPIDPPLQQIEGLITLAVRPNSSTSFRNNVAWMIECQTGWDIQFVGSVDFNVTSGYSNTLWSVALADMISDAGLCYSVNTTSHVITISSC